MRGDDCTCMENACEEMIALAWRMHASREAVVASGTHAEMGCLEAGSGRTRGCNLRILMRSRSNNKLTLCSVNKKLIFQERRMPRAGPLWAELSSLSTRITYPSLHSACA